MRQNLQPSSILDITIFNWSNVHPIITLQSKFFCKTIQLSVACIQTIDGMLLFSLNMQK